MSFLCDTIIWTQKFNLPKIIFVWILLASISNKLSDSGVLWCDAAPVTQELSTADTGRSLEMALKRVIDLQRVDNLTRQHGGDMFNAYGKFNFFFILSTVPTIIY